MTDLNEKYVALLEERKALVQSLKKLEKKGFFSKLLGSEKDRAKIIEQLANLDSKLKELAQQLHISKYGEEDEALPSEAAQSAEAMESVADSHHAASDTEGALSQEEQRTSTDEECSSIEPQESEEAEGSSTVSEIPASDAGGAVKSPSVDKAKQYFDVIDTGEIVLTHGLLERSYDLFYRLDELEDNAEATDLHDTLLRNFSMILLHGIAAKDGEPDSRAEVRAFFSYGITLQEKAKHTNEEVFAGLARNAYILGKEIAQKANLKGLIHQLEGAIMQLDEEFPTAKKRKADCFVLPNQDFRALYNSYVESLKSDFEGSMGMELEFDIDS